MSRAMKHSGIEWIGEIPKEWNLVRAKSLFAQRNSKGNESAVLLSATQKQGMMPQSLLEGVVQVNKNTDLQTFKTVHINDYVISLRSFQGGFEKSNYEGVCSPAYQVFYNITPIDHNYYWLLFKSYGFVDKINSLTVGIREGKNIQYKDFANMIIAVPPLHEQQKIANYLDKICGEIDEITALQEQMIEELKAYKQSVITEAVTKGLNPNVPMTDRGIDWIGKVPEHWEVRRIGHLFKLRDEKNYKPMDEVQLLSLYTGIGVFPHGEQEERGNKAITVEGYKVVHKDDIVVNIILAWMGAIGVSNYDGVTSPAYDVYIPDLSKVVPHFFHYVFRTQGIAGECYKYGRGIMMMRWRTYSSEFKQIRVPFPSMEEQRSIADFLDTKCSEIDALIAIKQQKIDELKDYKKSVIYEYVTGKKEVV